MQLSYFCLSINIANRENKLNLKNTIFHLQKKETPMFHRPKTPISRAVSCKFLGLSVFGQIIPSKSL